MSRARWVVVTMCAWIAAPAIAHAQFQWVKTRRDRQNDHAKKLQPAPIQLRPVGERGRGEPRVLKLRVWAARDYRAQTFDWQSRLRRLIERVNRLVADWPGVRFEIAEVKHWEVDSAARTLPDLLRELERTDKSEGTDWVIGLASSLPMIPLSIHDLGMARPLGHHFVLRSLHDIGELDAIEKMLDELEANTRNELATARKQHRELVVFLHEWAHTLGAIHALDTSLVMNPTYDNQQVRLCDPNARIVELALKRWPDEASLRPELLALISATRSEEWDPKDRDEAVAWLARPKEAPAGQPDDSQVLNLECDSITRNAAGPTRLGRIETACRKAADRSPADPWPVLMLAIGYLGSQDHERAWTAIAKGHQRLDYLTDGKPAQWRLLAEVYQRADAPSLAEAAAQKGGADAVAKTREWAIRERRHFGIPAGAPALGLEPEGEAEYIRRQRRLRDLIADGQLAQAAPLLVELEGRYPRLPAAPALRCQERLAAGKLEAARAACDEAVKRQEDFLAPHFYGAQVAVRRGARKEAAAHTTRAIELDPEVAPALRNAYLSRFKVPLP